MVGFPNNHGFSLLKMIILRCWWGLSHISRISTQSADQLCRTSSRKSRQSQKNATGFFNATENRALGGGFIFFSNYFQPYSGKIPILTSIFFRWVVQPPTRASWNQLHQRFCWVVFFCGRPWLEKRQWIIEGNICITQLQTDSGGWSRNRKTVPGTCSIMDPHLP